MTVQFSATVLNASANAMEAAIGAAPVINFYSGSAPASIADAATGTLIAQGTLPSDWLGDASGGSKSKAGTWTVTGLAAASTGTNAGYFRILASGGSTQHVQGTITGTGGGGDVTLDNVNIAENQVVTFSAFSLAVTNPA